MLKRLLLVFAISCLSALIIGHWLIVRIDPWTAVKYNMQAPPSITLTFDTIALVRGNDRVGAFRIVRNASSGSIYNGARYEYWLLPKGETDFSASAVSHDYGTVREGGLFGDQLYIQVGPLWVGWSHSNHVYPNPGDGPISPIEITATPWTSIEAVDIESDSLRWISLSDGLDPWYPKPHEHDDAMSSLQAEDESDVPTQSDNARNESDKPTR